MIEAVIFDIGNVLLSFDFGRVVRRIAPQCGVKVEDFNGRLEPLKMDLESGRISGANGIEYPVTQIMICVGKCIVG